ncbi:coiled-coil domain-containing protein 96 [Meriones unguiculatus]|uniref:coiled-coil domain-containing protein 96 n=1 Tax=Meriones unguiculatus TaxID=10047 RepID=UPI000B4F55A0|nr:coiled-coil domain-containing protein 96 [Meriones unguiculatus]
MDSHDRDPAGEGGAEESLTGQRSEIKVSSEPQIPADLAESEPKRESEPVQEPDAGLQPEPEPEPESQSVAEGAKTEASEERASEHVEVLEVAEAAEDAGEAVGDKGEAVSREPESLPETQSETEPEPKEPEDDEDEVEDEDDYEDEEFDKPEKHKEKKRKGSRFRPSLPLTTIVEESAALAPGVEKKKSEHKKGIEAKEVTGRERRRNREEHLHPREEEDEDDDDKEDFDDFEWSADVQKVQEQQLRGELVGQYRNLLVERTRYQRYNMYLQQKIQESLRKKGLEGGVEPVEKVTEPESPEKEQAYLRYLAMLEELKKQEADDLQWYREEVRELKQQCQEKQARVEKEWRRFQALKKQVVLQVMGSCRMRGGRQAALREVEQIQALEDKKEKEMSAVRLENVQLKQCLVHFETRMKAQEDLAEGLLLIDFEQLKIENQTFNEKVEERNEELLKLRSKVTSNVQIITHVKEKLSFIDMENTCKKAHLLEIEAQVALGRDLLTKTKQARDNLRTDNIKLNQKCGLLGKESLLRDMEEKVEKTEQLNKRLESLKRHHAGLTLSCKGVKQKIRETKAFLPP